MYRWSHASHGLLYETDNLNILIHYISTQLYPKPITTKLREHLELYGCFNYCVNTLTIEKLK